MADHEASASGQHSRKCSGPIPSSEAAQGFEGAVGVQCGGALVPIKGDTFESVGKNSVVIGVFKEGQQRIRRQQAMDQLLYTVDLARIQLGRDQHKSHRDQIGVEHRCYAFAIIDEDERTQREDSHGKR